MISVNWNSTTTHRSWSLRKENLCSAPASGPSTCMMDALVDVADSMVTLNQITFTRRGCTHAASLGYDVVCRLAISLAGFTILPSMVDGA